MEIINVFIAVSIVIAVGFWRNTSKEQQKMVKKASFTRTLILSLLTAWVIFFYYKSYQVATFMNKIEFKSAVKKYYDVDTIQKLPIYLLSSMCGPGGTGVENKELEWSGDTLIIDKKIIHDTIKSMVLLNGFTNKLEGFSNNPMDCHDPLSDFFWVDEDSHSQNSGIRTFIQLNDSFHKRNGNEDNLYNLQYYTNTIPQLLPFIQYRSIYPIEALYKDSVKKDNKVGRDYDRAFLLQIGKGQYSDSLTFHRASIANEFINNLNFFSAADLSQCEYKIELSSDIPIEQFCMYFNLPVEISSIDITKRRKYNYRGDFDLPEITSVNPINNNISSRGFSIHLEEGDDGNIDSFLHLIVHFPTFANLQLIRSLILTTILTALLSLTLANIYFLSRKFYFKYVRKRKEKYSQILRYLWIPISKTILWTLILIIIYIFYLSISDNPFILNIYESKQFVYNICVGFGLYVILLWDIFYLLYKNGIDLTSIKDKLKKSYYRYKDLLCKQLKRLPPLRKK